MEDDTQDLRELVAQLRAENDKLRLEQATARQPSVAPSEAPSLSSNLASVVNDDDSVRSTASSVAPLTERLVFVPRDRKCPQFSGRSSMNIEEWIEEAQACMRARHLARTDQAFFLYDHLTGEARDEIKYRPSEERRDPDKIISILRELYGCSKSYVALQEAFFSRKQQDGETLQEFSLALLSLMDKVKQSAPDAVPNSDVLLRDQFTEHVLDGALRRELKQLVRRQPRATLLEVRAEAIRWEREGMPGAVRARSYSLPSTQGIQYAVQGGSRLPGSSQSHSSELAELKDILKQQQDQLNQLTRSLASLQGPRSFRRPSQHQPVICRRCQRPGHYARECDGERVQRQPLPPALSVDRPFGGNPPQLPTPAENLYPPNC